MKPYCAFCRTENGPLIAAPAGEVAFICCDCAKSCILLFIKDLKETQEAARVVQGG